MTDEQLVARLAIALGRVEAAILIHAAAVVVGRDPNTLPTIRRIHECAHELAALIAEDDGGDE